MSKLDEINARILSDLYTEAKPVCVDGQPDAHKILLKIDGQSFWIDGYQDTEKDANWMRLMIGKALLALIQKYL
jgi:hypothetical protein